MTFDEKIKKSMEEIIAPMPLFDFNIMGVSFFIWKDIEFSVEAIETEPYETNGTFPFLLVRFAWIELIFKNKRLYRFVYNRRNPLCPLEIK